MRLKRANEIERLEKVEQGQVLTSRAGAAYRSPNPGRISSTSFANLSESPFVTTICLR